MSPFIVYALPRSRTFWLSKFLTYGDWSCGHDEIRHARSLDDVRNWFAQPCTGTVETAGASWWRLAREICPDALTVVVRRPVADVVDSLIHTGVPFDRAKITETMKRLDGRLDQIERRVPDTLSVTFADLATERGCAQVFGHCLPYCHDPAWWAALAPINLQINFHHLMRYYLAHAAQLDRLAKIAKQHTLAGMSFKRVSAEGVTFQQEPLDVVLRDGAMLMREHLAQVGESPDALVTKNLALMRKLERLGCLQMTTARSNGRLFGYLMSVIGPSLEAVGATAAAQTTFFASKQIPGLGPKLQRASIEALRHRGVGKVTFRAGTRGSGPKMGALYRRMGAEDLGQMFTLDLEGAA